MLNFHEIFLLPNLISLFRLLLILPVFYIIFYQDSYNDFTRNMLLLIICIAFISDVLDGLVARKKKLVSEFGKALDPFADKVLTIAIIFYLFNHSIIDTFYFILIISRDLIIFIGGLALSKRIGKILPSNILGKIAILSIGIYLITLISDFVSENVLLIFYYFSIAMCFISLIGYSVRAYDLLKWNSIDAN